jgi:WD40 repeat protein
MGLTFSDDGQMLITYAANPENQVALWRVPTGTKLASYPVSQFDEVQAEGTPFAVAQDMSVVAVAPNNTTIHLIDLPRARMRWTEEKAADEAVKALALSPDGKILASGAGWVESAIRLWDVATGREIRRLQGHRVFVIALVFWPDGKTLASASGDQTIRLWDLTDIANVPPPRVLRGHKGPVWRLALLPDSKTLVSGCQDGSVYLWDTTTIQHKQTHVILPASVAAWRFAPDGKSVLTVDLQGRAAQWKGTDFQESESLMDIATEFSYYRWLLRYSVLISRDARWLATGSTNGTIRVWDLRARTLLGQSTVSAGGVLPLEFVAQGKRLMVVHVDDGSVHEWDLTTWQESRSWQGAADTSYPTFSQDGRWSLALGGEGASFLREIATGRETNHRLDFRGVNATFSPDGRFFAAASEFNYAKLWETATFRELATFRGFLNAVHSVAFSPDGGRLALGGDGSEAVKLWDVESYQELLTLEGDGSLFGSTAFSPDGNIVGSRNGQGKLHLWRAPSWAEIEAAEKKLESRQSP